MILNALKLGDSINKNFKDTDFSTCRSTVNLKSNFRFLFLILTMQ